MADDQSKTSVLGQGVGPMGERGTITATLRDATGNPGPLGLMAFGLTTVLLNVHNAGLIPLSGIILAMGVFYGGLAQVVAGIMEWKKNSTFGMTAFLSYGFFWLTFVGIFAFPKWIGSTGLDLGATSTALGVLPARLGPVHCADVRRDAAHQPVAADGVPEPHHPVRAPRHRRVDGQRDDHQDRWLGGHLRRPLRRVRLNRPGVERAV